MDTIEGVSGEVPKNQETIASSDDNGQLLTYDDEQELKKGESGMSSGSSEGPAEFQLEQAPPITKTLDLEGVKIVEQ